MVVPAVLCAECKRALQACWRAGLLKKHCQRRELFALLDLLRTDDTERCPVCVWMALRLCCSKDPNLEHGQKPQTRQFRFMLWEATECYEREWKLRPRINAGHMLVGVSFEGFHSKEHGVYFYISPLGSDQEVVEPIPQSTGSDQTFCEVRTWFDNCSENHSECTHLPAWVPNRLVHLSVLEDGSIHAALEQAASNDYSNTVKYTTLSHRWLPGETARLNNTNILEYLVSIPIDSQKACIRDAMTISLRLGITYIWIDSLCIVQDDVADKAQEVEQMGLIYSHSSCTIAADWAHDLNHGCFENRQEEYSAEYSVDLTLDKDSRALRSHRMVVAWEHTATKRESVLESRAWVYQERVLSPRVLHYGNETTWWVCREMVATENGDPQGRSLSSVDSEFADIRSAIFSHRTHRFKQMWFNIVGEYSAKQLTFDQDRLAALEGIAKLCLKSREDVYLYGLWKSTLPRSLLWRRDNCEELNRRLQLAPSWSWASVSGSVCGIPWYDDGRSPQIKDIASMVWSDAPLTSSLHEERDTTDSAEDLIQLRSCPWETTLSAVVPEHLNHSQKESFPWRGVLSIFLDNTVEWASTTCRVTLFPILLETPDDASEVIFGLVLLPVSAQNDLYRRIGAFIFPGPNAKTSKIIHLPYFGWNQIPDGLLHSRRKPKWEQALKTLKERIVTIC